MSPLFRILTENECKALIERGYRRTSCKYGTISRIDRPDWQALLERERRRDLTFGNGDHEDFWRRCRSHDTMDFGDSLPRNFPSSCGDSCGYIPEAGDPPKELLSVSEKLALAISALETAEAHIVLLYRAINPHANDGDGNRMADQDEAVAQIRAAIVQAKGE